MADSIRIIYPPDNWLFLSTAVRVEVQARVDGAITAKLDGASVALTQDGRGYVFDGTVAQGMHTFTATVGGDTATLNFSVAGLITDRTQSDVDEARDLLIRAAEGDAESYARARDENLRGAYNASDMNRVGFATEHAAAVWRALDYDVAEVTAKQTFVSNAAPTDAEFSAYLADSAAIHDAVPAALLAAFDAALPDAPASMKGFDYAAANAIETILTVSATTAGRIARNTSAWASGELVAGEE